MNEAAKQFVARWGAAAVVMAIAPLSAHGATAAEKANNAAESQPQVQAVREIDDPSSGARWLLLHDPSNEGGPGRMVMAEDLGGRGNTATFKIHQIRYAWTVAPAPLPPVIRGGDRLVVEENSDVVEARLAAVALGPAAIGIAFQARLQIGGKIVRVVALGPGRAEFGPQIEVHR